MQIASLWVLLGSHQMTRHKSLLFVVVEIPIVLMRRPARISLLDGCCNSSMAGHYRLSLWLINAVTRLRRVLDDIVDRNDDTQDK